MSVTFWCPEAPRKQVPCRFCTEEWAEFPEGNGKGGKCDRFCTGFEEASEAPEANFGNTTTVGLLGLLGFDSSNLFGSCDGATLRQRLFRARNSSRSHLVENAYDHAGGDAGVRVSHEGNVARVERMGARVVSFGNTDEETLRRLTYLEALAVYAQDNGFEISWG